MTLFVLMKRNRQISAVQRIDVCKVPVATAQIKSG